MRARRPYRRNIIKLRREQGCLTDCVAYVLNIHPERVPYFVYPRRGWLRRFKRFWRRRGVRAYWIRSNRAPTRGTHIVCGNSLKWKTYAHVVVYRGGKLVFDPQYPSKWCVARMTHRLVLARLKD